MDVDDSKPGLPNPSAISWLFLKTIYFSNLVHVTAWNAILTPQSIWWILASLLAQTVKNLHPMRETWVWSLGPEDSLEKGMATHSSILAWEIPWTEEFGGLQSMGSQSWTRLSNQHYTTLYYSTFSTKHQLFKDNSYLSREWFSCLTQIKQ